MKITKEEIEKIAFGDCSNCPVQCNFEHYRMVSVYGHCVPKIKKHFENKNNVVQPTKNN